MLALQQVPIGRVEADGRAIAVRPSHETGPSEDLEQHHIASSERLLRNLRHDHVG